VQKIDLEISAKSKTRAANKIKFILLAMSIYLCPGTIYGFDPKPLTICTVYTFDEASPRYLKRIDEGDVAYYGLVVQAEGDEDIVRYLKKHANNYLWGYHQGYAPTAADSAIVIEGLYHAGYSPELLRKSLTRLFEYYYNPSDGGFKTVVSGKAKYWFGSSVETTAHVAYLMDVIAPRKFPQAVSSSMRYTASKQREDGNWYGKWYPSLNIPTYYAVRLLARQTNLYGAQLEKAAAYLRGSQERNGSWDDSIIETAAGLLAFKKLGCCKTNINKAIAWLNTLDRSEYHSIEPILYYWFESAQEKIFYSCTDRGKISEAWRRLALESSR